MSNLLTAAIQSAQEGQQTFAKFITANDTGATGAHQAGFHISKGAWSLFFDTPGSKGANKDKLIRIKWQDSFETDSRAIYYGVGTRNEYRLTRFGRGFPFLQDENIGDLLVIVKVAADYFQAYVLTSDEDIDEFQAALNISVSDLNGIIPRQSEQTAEDMLLACFWGFIKAVKVDFPLTKDIATNARECYLSAYKVPENAILSQPDKELLNWLNAEFQLFKVLENDRYSKKITTPFATVEELITTANTILNRRKSRAGKSLEHHLSEIFTRYRLNFSNQAFTEDNKRPDFLFPGVEAYASKSYNESKLTMLAAKTTCKDRWRQVLNEADRIKVKHLFTLQQGISRNQLQEMYNYNVCLVVPEPHVKSFPPEYRERIITLKTFVEVIQSRQ
jgi:type II restriction enzyme